MNLDELRTNIDGIDEKLVDLLKERMAISKEVALYKKEKELPVENRRREQEILQKVTSISQPPLDRYFRILFNTLFDVSKSYQNTYLTWDTPLKSQVADAISSTPKTFPKTATVACQGVEGSHSQAAAENIFEFPNITFLNSFDGVFNAVEKGLCDFGILPIENSSFGSVGQIYDLMKNYKFSIVKCAKVQISHKLMAKPGVSLGEIKEIYSHEQALGQCSSFIKDLKGVKITHYPNTAMAAEAVAKSDRTDLAAISSKSCSELYGLKILKEDIQLTDHNYTRFICISKDMAIYPDANKISIMLSISHKALSLYHTLAKFSVLGINLTKLESRPIPGSNFEFMFYLDMEASMHNEELIALLCELDAAPETFVFLGAYSEI